MQGEPIGLTGSSAYEVVRRIDVGEPLGGWFAIAKAEGEEDTFVQDLDREASVWWGVEIRKIDVARAPLAHLIELLQQPSDDGVLVRGLEKWSDSRLKALDIRRSALERPGFVILLLPQRGIERLFQHAPNISSWVRGSEFKSGPDPGLMSEEERRAHLTELSEHYRLTDSDVIRMAESGSLPPEPEFVEWLILLNRGDLVKG